MSDALAWLDATLGLDHWLEILAVALGFAYVILAIRQQRACWIAGGLSTALYVWIFLDSRLYLQSALQVLYVALAVYGWWVWRPGPDAASDKPVRWSLGHQLAMVAAVVLLVAVSVPLLSAYTDSASPWLDSLWSWASVAATWMMARRVLENWLWWIVIDLGLTVMFLSEGLGPTALLYITYTVLAVAGWLAWRRDVQAPAA